MNKILLKTKIKRIKMVKRMTKWYKKLSLWFHLYVESKEYYKTKQKQTHRHTEQINARGEGVCGKDLSDDSWWGYVGINCTSLSTIFIV